MAELTIVRYNRYFSGSNELINVIQDITPIEENEKDKEQNILLY